MPAPSRLPDVADRLVMLLGSGVAPRSAAEQVGIGYPTLTRWLRLGAAGDPRYRELHRARSEPQPVPADVLDRLKDADPGIVGAIIRAAQAGDWRAAAWIAERAREGLTNDEREELRRLRRENRRLEQEREILK